MNTRGNTKMADNRQEYPPGANPRASLGAELVGLVGEGQSPLLGTRERHRSGGEEGNRDRHQIRGREQPTVAPDTPDSVVGTQAPRRLSEPGLGAGQQSPPTGLLPTPMSMARPQQGKEGLQRAGPTTRAAAALGKGNPGKTEHRVTHPRAVEIIHQFQQYNASMLSGSSAQGAQGGARMRELPLQQETQGRDENLNRPLED